MAELQRFKQTKRKLFDADPNNAKQLKDRHHNYERSVSMQKNLELVGLDDTPIVNQKITEHLLKVGKTVTPENNLWVPSIFEGPKGKLKIESTWKILDNGTNYLTTLKLIPIE